MLAVEYAVRYPTFMATPKSLYTPDEQGLTPKLQDGLVIINTSPFLSPGHEEGLHSLSCFPALLKAIGTEVCWPQDNADLEINEGWIKLGESVLFTDISPDSSGLPAAQEATARSTLIDRLQTAQQAADLVVMTLCEVPVNWGIAQMLIKDKYGEAAFYGAIPEFYRSYGENDRDRGARWLFTNSPVRIKSN